MAGFVAIAGLIFIVLGALGLSKNGSLTRGLKSSDLKVRGEAGSIATGVIILGILCLLYFTWPLVLAGCIIYFGYKIVQKI
jgi:hypothetical protein